MSVELPKTYESKKVEDKWYKTWEEGKYFKPRPGKQGKAFTIIMPPPNVTGVLHAGHALDIVTQDALIRFKRMKGFEALFLPGMDHAGIATQAKVEAMVWEQEGKTKHDFEREEFVAKIWKWKQEYGGIIAKQQKVMGASPDWDYSVFTLDKEPNEAVNKFFVDMYNEGLIYQSDYIINWDPELQSAISDAEVEHKDVNGKFYHLLYKVKDSNETLEIATTRPETLLGDTAVCVNPNDDRFKHLIGKSAIVPICNREVPILGDEYVDMEKGTGCLKVTPGHDFNDFDIGQRHNLEIINILNKDGTLNDKGLQWEGKSCKETRSLIIEELTKLDLFVKSQKHSHSVGHGDRSGAVIEPLVSKQWFLNVKDMAAEAVSAIEDSTTKFYPKNWENTYYSWLREPKNWCLSRQLWWGHRIPVFYCGDCNHQWASVNQEKSCVKCSSDKVSQDPDVLDTWFSSGLWPFSTLGWPDKTRMKERGFDKFFPTSTLITGFDIIFFWVARMMMMSLKALGKVPFDHIYIHAIVRDKFGRKMSKSLDNGIDPLDTVDQYGADAFRFTLAAGSGYNRGLNLDPERINGYRNFINKVWNAYRFISPYLNEAKSELPKDLSHHERWILSELNTVAQVMNESIDEYRYDDSCSAIYSFVYDKFCSWFIELSKKPLNGDDKKVRANRASVLKYCFREIVTLLHPFTPFITEELWTQLKEPEEDLLIVSEYTEYKKSLEYPEDQDKMNKFVEMITGIRNLRQSVNLKPKEEVQVYLFSNDQKLNEYYNQHLESIKELAKASKVTTASLDSTKPSKSIMLATTHTEIYLPLEGLIDIGQQVSKLEKDMGKAQKEFQKFDKKLKNEKFLQNATEEVIFETKQKHNDFLTKLNSIKDRLTSLK